MERRSPDAASPAPAMLPTRRRAPRTAAALPVRFTVDGGRFHAGVVTSMSRDGLFLKTPVGVEAGSQVWVEVSLGREAGPVRSLASVVYVNRTFGPEVVPGLGLALDDTDPARGARIEEALARYPGPIEVDRSGAIRWPFGDLAPAATDAALAGPAPVDAARTVDGRTRLVHRGRALAPRSGVARERLETLLDGSDAAGPRFVEAIALQRAVVDLLDDVGWELDRLDDGASARLTEIADAIAERVRGADEQTRPTGDALASELRSNLATLAAFVDRLCWPLAPTGELSHEDAAAFEAFRAARAQAAALAPREPPARRASGPRWHSTEAARALGLAAFLVLPTLFSGAFVFARWRATFAAHPSSATRSYVSSLEGWGEGDVYHVELVRPWSWEDDGALALKPTVIALAESGYNEARFYRSGRVVAVWDDGLIQPSGSW